LSTVTVGLAARSYDIVIENNALADAARHLAPWTGQGRLVVVTDRNVAASHLAALTSALDGTRIDPIVLPAGESTKSWAHLEQLCDALLALEIERSEAIIALGGGVIGDLTGFAASIVKRGCSVVQIPTTLLSQVDSSVGGKTAINTRAGKNLIGAFYQPSFVLIDPATLDTLPVREVRAGYAEVVKYGLIGDPAARTHAIETSVRAKAAIVGEDERETSGRRALLNLGHTFGHALEAETGYSDRLLHGEAVAAGMAIAFRFSAARGLCSTEDALLVTAHLHQMGLPTSARAADLTVSGSVLAAHMSHDKKREGGTVPFLLARGIGQTFLDKSVSLDEVASFLDSDAG
jgi:3-dehydroquinate synthase